MKDIFGLEIRKNVLKFSLLYESLCNATLIDILGRGHLNESKTFGTGSGSLSFNQKLNLLVDIGEYSKEEKKLFQIFMEVRNQFMHNFNADNFVNCLSFIDGGSKRILKLFPQNDSDSEEIQLMNAFKELNSKLMSIIFRASLEGGTKIQMDLIRKEALGDWTTDIAND